MFTPPVPQSRTYFNSRPRVRAVNGARVAICSREIFQFSPSREGGLWLCRVLPSSVAFQFSPSREGGPVAVKFPVMIFSFQFSPSREGGLSLWKRATTPSYFNSRPRVRAVPDMVSRLPQIIISILALA